MTQMLGGEDDAIFVANSHVFKAVRATASVDDFRFNMMRKVVEEILPEENQYLMLLEIGRGVVSPEIMKRLKKGVKALL
ncbi:hypothetical protein MMC14_007543, partial [Varicellaria rhodocarpa]|nr:hypothetical protein [Varicellaria rhodocarpa]